MENPGAKPSILYQSADFVAVSKPTGWWSHPPREGTDDAQVMLGWTRDQIGQWVFPVHRLDRATSGVMVFALSAEAARVFSQALNSGVVQKTYRAVVRGHLGIPGERGKIDKPLVRDPESRVNTPKPSQTEYETVRLGRLAVPLTRYPELRVSEVRLIPRTGRRHQIRRHLLSLRHPIVGDTIYGDGDVNRAVRAHLGERRLMLHAERLEWIGQFAISSEVPEVFSSFFAEGVSGNTSGTESFFPSATTLRST